MVKKAIKPKTATTTGKKPNFLFFFRDFKVVYFTTFFLMGLLAGIALMYLLRPVKVVEKERVVSEYWMKLMRQSNKEHLFKGIPGDEAKSTLVRTFDVKVGIPGERPTPLPQLVGREYWKIIKKYSSSENPETAPYFLELDIPVEDAWPYGPVPYNECNGEQCNWELPGYFGLHGVNGDLSRLGPDNPGSSGCIRHTDEDITFLYNILPVDEGVRYYIEDK